MSHIPKPFNNPGLSFTLFRIHDRKEALNWIEEKIFKNDDFVVDSFLIKDVNERFFDFKDSRRTSEEINKSKLEKFQEFRRNNPKIMVDEVFVKIKYEFVPLNLSLVLYNPSWKKQDKDILGLTVEIYSTNPNSDIINEIKAKYFSLNKQKSTTSSVKFQNLLGLTNLSGVFVSYPFMIENKNDELTLNFFDYFEVDRENRNSLTFNIQNAYSFTIKNPKDLSLILLADKTELETVKELIGVKIIPLNKQIIVNNSIVQNREKTMKEELYCEKLEELYYDFSDFEMLSLIKKAERLSLYSFYRSVMRNPKKKI